MIEVIYDNIVFSLQQVGGISNYWYQLSIRALKNNFKISFIERVDGVNIYQKLLKDEKRILLPTCRVPLLIDRFKFIKINRKDAFIFHSSYNRVSSNSNAIQIFTVHDLIHEKYYNGIRKFIHVYQRKRALNSANHIITVSQNTKNDLLKYYPYINENKVSVIYNGSSSHFFNLNLERQNFLLYVGGREKYKNFEACVKTISNFRDFKLVIVGSRLKKHETKLMQFYLKDNWENYSNISDEDLNILYNKAFALVYPSLYEGFGIPILEAMNAGCPFIALNKSSIPEVAGNAGVLINNINYEEIKQALNLISYNREAIVDKGYLQARKFSWDKTYLQTFELYKRVVNENIANYSSL